MHLCALEGGEGYNDPKPYLAREEGSVPFVFVGSKARARGTTNLSPMWGGDLVRGPPGGRDLVRGPTGGGEGDNKPKPSLPMEEGSVPFLFVGKALKFWGKGDNEHKPSMAGGRI